MNRQTKYTAYASVYVLIIVGVLGAINFLANRYNKSFDSTANKTFSLSEQTEKIVKNLTQDVKISYFDEAQSLERSRDLLDRYKNLSPKVTVDFVRIRKAGLEANADRYSWPHPSGRGAACHRNIYFQHHEKPNRRGCFHLRHLPAPLGARLDQFV